LLLPPCSVIGSLDQAKIWSMVSRLPSSVNIIKSRCGKAVWGNPENITVQCRRQNDVCLQQFFVCVDNRGIPATVFTL